MLVTFFVVERVIASSSWKHFRSFRLFKTVSLYSSAVLVVLAVSAILVWRAAQESRLPAGDYRYVSTVPCTYMHLTFRTSVVPGTVRTGTLRIE